MDFNASSQEQEPAGNAGQQATLSGFTSLTMPKLGKFNLGGARASGGNPMLLAKPRKGINSIECVYEARASGGNPIVLATPRKGTKTISIYNNISKKPR